MRTARNARPEKPVMTGLDRFLEDSDRYRKGNIALIANQTSVSQSLEYSWNALAAKGLHLKKIFSPEHGLWSTEQDQIAVAGQPSLPCEIVSLYGSGTDSLAPPESALDGIDLVLFDIQDIGSRYYTYVNTMALFMRSLHGKEVRFMVLDRPNPIGGKHSEGPPLESGFESFVGVFNVPVRHGCTAGELALFYKEYHHLDVDLAVVEMKGWRRHMAYTETGLPWIGPSPNMPDTDTALVYPGMCLLEGTNLSEGRGTTMPFRLFGAPFINPDKYARELNSQGLPGVHFRPTYFKPSFHKYAGEVTGGIFIHVTDEDSFRPFITGVAAVKTAFDLYGDRMEFITTPYEYTTAHPAFDLLTGGDMIRTAIHAGENLEQIHSKWKKYEDSFSGIAARFSLYR